MSSDYLSSRFVPEGLTYDDVLLVPGYSEVLPRETIITSYFTQKIKLNTRVNKADMISV